jgi:hypothetical protein
MPDRWRPLITAGQRRQPSSGTPHGLHPTRTSRQAELRGTQDKLPVRMDVRRMIGKDVGDTVTVHLLERLA